MDAIAFLKTRRSEILDRVSEVCRIAGRLDMPAVIAVSKTVDAQTIAQAQQAGWDLFGENRPQALVAKQEVLATLTESIPVFDMIGNLQTNKINSVLGRVRLIHSISSLHLAEAVSKRAVAKGLVQDVLLEVNISGEQSKSGFATQDISVCIDELLELQGIRIQGLMTMAPKADRYTAQKTFEGLRILRDQLKVQTGLSLESLSAGMSDDYDLALLEGANILRLGRICFDSLYNVC